ncbi:hypothetical protein ACFZAR_36165 [Streptomyces sp. NPDC008222]|uniref:hypothetical protein n=1 Tax=Streptomyces sp. NPDC008222 TaxID=3364820 RepID=UPI0036EE8B6C
MTDNTGDCCPDCGQDLTAVKQRIVEERRLADEAAAALAAIEAEIRVTLEQRMADGLDIVPILEGLEREGVDVSQLLFS